MNEIQQNVFDFFKSNSKSIALIGSAGTGKSFVCKKLCEYAIQNGKNLAKTAMTGVAAELIDGQTLHSPLGLAPSFQNDDKHSFARIKRLNKEIFWAELDILFVDECSMMTRTMFESLDRLARVLRKSSEVFGGLRLIFSGDFLQLGPVSAKTEGLVFESPIWQKVFENGTFLFSESIRHSQDAKWKNILNNIRIGTCSPSDMTQLMARRHVKMNDPVAVYCTNKDVDAINSERLKKLIDDGNESRDFLSKTTCKPECSEEVWGYLKKPSVTLCVGAKVMLTVNDLARNLFNGSIGIVARFGINSAFVEFSNVEFEIFPKILEETLIIKPHLYCVRREFMPLQLCWAITVHKSQGKTLTCGEVNVANAFAPGQVYTALSRFPSLESFALLGFKPSNIKVCQKSLDFFKSFEK